MFSHMLKAILQGETLEEVEQDLALYLKKHPRKCVRCGQYLTAKDVLGSQGHHCQNCWQELGREIEEKMKTQKVNAILNTKPEPHIELEIRTSDGEYSIPLTFEEAVELMEDLRRHLELQGRWVTRVRVRVATAYGDG